MAAFKGFNDELTKGQKEHYLLYQSWGEGGLEGVMQPSTVTRNRLLPASNC